MQNNRWYKSSTSFEHLINFTWSLHDQYNKTIYLKKYISYRDELHPYNLTKCLPDWPYLSSKVAKAKWSFLKPTLLKIYFVQCAFRSSRFDIFQYVYLSSMSPPMYSRNLRDISPRICAHPFLKIYKSNLFLYPIACPF